MKKSIKFFTIALCALSFVACESKTLAFYKDCADNKVDQVRQKISKDPTLAMKPLAEKEVEAFVSYAYLDANANSFNVPLETAVKLGNKDVMRILYMEMSKAGYNFAENKNLSSDLLHFAVKENNVDMLREILSLNLDTDVEWNDTGVNIAAALFNEGNYDLAEEFFKKDGVTINRNVTARDFYRVWDDFNEYGQVKDLLLLAKYVSASDFTNITFSREISVTKPRMNGDDVEFIQEVLYDLDFLDSYSDVDGYYGPTSEGKVQAFQNWFGLPVTGVVDEATFDLLSRLYTLYEILMRVELI